VYGFKTDPKEKFKQLDELDFFEPINTFFGTIKRGGAGNLGGSTVIYPNFATNPFHKIANQFRGYGIKNSKAKRKYILENQDLLVEEAIHFAAKYDSNSPNGLESQYVKDMGMNSLFNHFNTKDSKKWRKIVNSTFGSQAQFDILIPRAARAKHSCYFNPFSNKVVLSTNFWYLADFQNGNRALSNELQKKFITAFMLSSFGQIQFEIHANNQEGLRKLEGFHINKFKIPDVRKLDKQAVKKVVTAFEALNIANPIFSGEEGLNTSRRNLDEAIGAIIYAQNRLGFEDVEDLVNFFELFLADLVEDRRQ